MNKNISLALWLAAAVVTQSSHAQPFGGVASTSPLRSFVYQPLLQIWDGLTGFDRIAAENAKKGFFNITKNCIISHKKALAITTVAAVTGYVLYKKLKAMNDENKTTKK